MLKFSAHEIMFLGHGVSIPLMRCEVSIRHCSCLGHFGIEIPGGATRMARGDIRLVHGLTKKAP